VMRTPDVGAFLENIERHRVTHTFLPPTLIYMVLGDDRLDATDRSSLQCFWYGAAPMSAARLEESLRRIGPVMAQLFGQTEAPMMISTLPPRDHFHEDGSVATQRLTSAGRPAPLVTVAIMGEDGSVRPRGERGEIVIRSSLVMAGYYRDPEATAKASAHGWHHTGDIGYRDGDGYYYVVDRKKDMILTGGFNVYPAEIERVVAAHPAVAMVAVGSVPDETYGELARAYVVLRPGVAATEAEIIEHCRAHLGAYKLPRSVRFVPDLPKTSTGKVMRRELKTLDG